MFLNSQIMALSDSEVAFEGLEDRLEEIRATDAHYITRWDWQQLRNMTRLSLVDVHLIAMYSLDQEFPRLPRLTHLGISRAEIGYVHPEAFSRLDALSLLVLRDNEISEMSRSMLPRPANHLHTIELSGNQLSILPEDMFTDMPNLELVELNENRFVTLNEDTFKWPLENLKTLGLKNNDLRCDCRLQWMVYLRKPFTFEAFCSLPNNLKEMSLRYLRENDLWC